MKTSTMTYTFGTAAVILGFLGGTGCTKFTVKTPQGFVVLKEKRNVRVLVSPDNTIIAVRAWDNHPKGDLSFWSATIKRDFANVRAYGFIEANSVKTDHGGQGRLLHFTGGYRGGLYDYYLALFVKGDTIYTVELVCRHKHVKQYLPAFQRVMRSLKFG